MSQEKKLLEFISRKKIWRSNPTLFLEEVLGMKSPSHQKIMIDAVNKNKAVSIRSANSIGKSHSISALILWFFFSYIDPNPDNNLIVVFTAPSFDQVKDNIYSKIKGFIDKANKNIKKKFGDGATFVGEISKAQNIAEIRFRHEDFIKGVTANKQENQLSGKHGKYVLIVYDEAQGVSEKSFSDFEGITKGGAVIKQVMIGNTTLPEGKVGQFYESFKPDSIWHKMQISAFDTQAFIEADIKLKDYFRKESDENHWINKVDKYCLVNYKNIDIYQLSYLNIDKFEQLEDLVKKIYPRSNAVKNKMLDIYEQVSKAILPFCEYLVNPFEVHEALQKCGYNINHYEFKTRVLAEFPDDSDASLFPMDWIEKSFANYGNLEAWERGNRTMGLDIASGMGADKSCVSIVDGNKEIYREQFDLRKKELLEKVIELYEFYKVDEIRVERDGIGYGYLQDLQDMNLPVIGIHVGGQPGYENPFTQEQIEETKSLKEQFGCKRDEIYWNLKEWLNPFDTSRKPFLIKPDNDIKREMGAIVYVKTEPKQKIQVIGKKELRKILNRSTDNLDSLLIATAKVDSDFLLLQRDFSFTTGH